MNAYAPVTFCLSESDAVHTIPVTSIAQPKDTTGAGDSFNGAYLASRALGYSQEVSIKRAISLSAKVINTHGALIEMSEAKASSISWPDQ